MTDFPRLTDGMGREYILRRLSGEADDAYRSRAAEHARLGIRYENVDQSLEQVVFIEADRVRLSSAVEDLRQRLSDAEYELYRATTYLDGGPDLERQFEIAFSYDCYGPYLRLIRIAGVEEPDIAEEMKKVAVPAAVRGAYRDLYRRGVAIMTIVERAYPVPREYAASMVEVQRLVDHMAKGGI